MAKSNITLYGSSLESLLLLFNFDNQLDEFCKLESFNESMPSLVVFSLVKEKNNDLIEIEMEHRQMQENIIGIKIEHSEDSYASLERDINVMLGASAIDITSVRAMIYSRMKRYIDDPQSLVRDIYTIAKERYKNYSSI